MVKGVASLRIFCLDPAGNLGKAAATSETPAVQDGVAATQDMAALSPNWDRGGVAVRDGRLDCAGRDLARLQID